MSNHWLRENRTNLLIERGYTRLEIAGRMIKAAPSLNVLSTPEQPLPGTQTIAYPSLEAVAGIELFNELVENHKIDAFWPQRSARVDLSNIACEIHAAASPDIVALLDDKKRFTDWLGNDPHKADAIEAIGAEEVASAYERFRDQGKEVCVKPAVGVSGHGYWKLTEVPEVSFLHDPDKREIYPHIYFEALARQEQDGEPQRLLVMDWLPGPEVSVDVLSWRGQPLIHAARTKLDRKSELAQSEHPVIEHARSLAGRLGLHGIINIQYMLDVNSEWKILEINPRPAGGSIFSEDGGFGIITGWARLISGEVDPSEIRQHEEEVMLTIAKMATRDAFTS